MKVHITNPYNYLKQNVTMQDQKKIAKTAEMFGFFEMGIPIYDVSTDSDSEMSKRQDGIIAAVEYGDAVILQLPLGNDQRFEDMLIHKVEAYSGKKPILLWNNEEYYVNNVEKYGEYNNKFEKQIDTFTNLELQKFILDLLPDEKSDTYDDSDYIHIGFGLYDKDGTYSVWVGTAMQSIIENTDARIVFHILHDSTLTTDNRDKLLQVARSGGHKAEFHYIDSSKFDEVKDMMSYFTIGTMFRLLLPEVLPDLDKIIYLDADLFVNRDIEELWNENIQDYCLAAVVDEGTLKSMATPYPVTENQVNRDKYFNAGVLYMNLKEIRKHGNLCENILKYLSQNKKAVCPDQDALNVIYKDKCKYIEQSWNCFVKYNRNNKIENMVYHYAGIMMVLYYNNEVDELYLNYLRNTPWGKEAGRKQINNSIGLLNRRIDNLENIVRQVSRYDRKCIFYGPKTFAMQNMMKMLNCNSSSYDTLKDDILENKNKYIVFVLPESDEGKGIDILINHGWINQEDFFVIPCILDATQGGYIF
ncbi:glycosyltransferase [Agathobacter sp.]